MKTAAKTARPRLPPTLTMEPAAVAGVEVEGDAEEPDSVPVPVPVPVEPPVVEPLEGAVFDVALAARALNSVKERVALAAVLHTSC